MARRKVRKIKKGFYILCALIILGLGVFAGIKFDLFGLFSKEVEPIKKKMTK